MKLQDSYSHKFSYIPVIQNVGQIPYSGEEWLGTVPAEVQSHVNIYVHPVHHHLSFIINVIDFFSLKQVGNAIFFFKPNISNYFMYNSNWKRVIEYVWSNSFWKWLFSLFVYVWMLQTYCDFVHQWWEFFGDFFYKLHRYKSRSVASD